MVVSRIIKMTNLHILSYFKIFIQKSVFQAGFFCFLHDIPILGEKIVHMEHLLLACRFLFFLPSHTGVDTQHVTKDCVSLEQNNLSNIFFYWYSGISSCTVNVMSPTNGLFSLLWLPLLTRAVATSFANTVSSSATLTFCMSFWVARYEIIGHVCHCWV